MRLDGPIAVTAEITPAEPRTIRLTAVGVGVFPPLPWSAGRREDEVGEECRGVADGWLVADAWPVAEPLLGVPPDEFGVLADPVGPGVLGSPSRAVAPLPEGAVADDVGRIGSMAAVSAPSSMAPGPAATTRSWPNRSIATQAIVDPKPTTTTQMRADRKPARMTRKTPLPPKSVSRPRQADTADAPQVSRRHDKLPCVKGSSSLREGSGGSHRHTDLMSV